jgi:hypothetical protein
MLRGVHEKPGQESVVSIIIVWWVVNVEDVYGPIGEQ